MAGDRGGSTNPGTIGSIKFQSTTHLTIANNPEGRGGATNSAKGPTGTQALGTQSTNPTSKTGKPTGNMGAC